MREVIIVGAGLSGLSAAYYLKKKGIDALILEAGERWGGRIDTVYAEGNATPVEMGATWFNEQHTHLVQLLRELKLPHFKQFQKGVGVFETELHQEPQLFQIPDSEESSYRIAGGTSKLTDALAHQIGQDQIVLGSPIAEVTEHRDYIEVITGKGNRFVCRNLLITIPPFLILSQNISFDPPLPGEVLSVMASTHTWMGDAIKFAVEYEAPFWRKEGYSGTVFSHSGIATEMYDHCDSEGTHYALMGFLTTAASSLSKGEREARLIGQLTRLLGQEAANYLSYTERVWAKEYYTFADYGKFVMPHQNNGHPLYSKPLMDGKLRLCGTETSPQHGGYMNGAVSSGLVVAQLTINKVRGV
ncbi:monoamine oxidase [Pontibacter aydingkolensis]|uniref:FAD-dependent oxidoreductase n=1 Tax=Pontibacter aydingkolensis TaxID=1911536 RepID=A0ABS7CVA5_9BACT|nr:FAD-dependent oxidoreductase [Pontibacter aydingkolensis]MBW7467796.1 FAD-dependent oxidoreductase [Pontibacter aydingkolensis]